MTCQACGTPLVRKRWPCGVMENPAQFAIRRFCGLACAKVKSVLKKSGHRARAQRLRGNRCEWPGGRHHWELHAHHRDGDFTNNDPANVATLCRTHHIKTHGKRTWDDRKRRRAKAA